MPLYILVPIIFISTILIVGLLPLVAITLLAIAYLYFLYTKREYTIVLPPSPIYIGKEEKQYYLSSAQWLMKRLSVKHRDKVCVACGQPGTEVHHLHYRNWKKEPLKDLVLLCRSCHQLQHDKYGYNHDIEYIPIIYPKSRL
jgi:hypothetical protein